MDTSRRPHQRPSQKLGTEKGQTHKGTPETDYGRKGIRDRDNLTLPGPCGNQRRALLHTSPSPEALTVHVAAQHGFFKGVHATLLQPLLGRGRVQADEVLGLTEEIGTSLHCPLHHPTAFLTHPSSGGLRLGSSAPAEVYCQIPKPWCRGVGGHTFRKGALGELSNAPLWPCSSCRAS